MTIASGEGRSQDQVQVVVVIGEGGTQDRVAMWAEEHPGSQDRVAVWAEEHPGSQDRVAMWAEEHPGSLLVLRLTIWTSIVIQQGSQCHVNWQLGEKKLILVNPG